MPAPGAVLACMPVMCLIPCLYVKSPHSNAPPVSSYALFRQVGKRHECMDLCMATGCSGHTTVI